MSAFTVSIRWALRDEALSRESAAAVVGPVALAPPLTGSSQVGVEQPAPLLIAPDVTVDSLVADEEPPRPARVPRDLLGAPPAAQQLVNERVVFGSESLVAT